VKKYVGFFKERKIILEENIRDNLLRRFDSSQGKFGQRNGEPILRIDIPCMLCKIHRVGLNCGDCLLDAFRGKRLLGCVMIIKDFLLRRGFKLRLKGSKVGLDGSMLFSFNLTEDYVLIECIPKTDYKRGLRQLEVIRNALLAMKEERN